MNQQEENFDNINFAETKEETDKKCPQCGGIMDFDPKTGHMKCGFCDYEEEIAVSDEEPQKADELDFDLVDKTANKNWGVEKKTVICEACTTSDIPRQSNRSFFIFSYCFLHLEYLYNGRMRLKKRYYHCIF